MVCIQMHMILCEIGKILSMQSIVSQYSQWSIVDGARQSLLAMHASKKKGKEILHYNLLQKMN